MNLSLMVIWGVTFSVTLPANFFLVIPLHIEVQIIRDDNSNRVFMASSLLGFKHICTYVHIAASLRDSTGLQLKREAILIIKPIR